MAFKEVTSLDSDTTIALGGRNKLTGKANPTTITGYYIGSKNIASPRAKLGYCKLHVLQTAKGNIGVWGKTDLDRKIEGVSPGVMIRATMVGMQSIPGKNDMYKFKVEVDEDNTVEVALPDETAPEPDQDEDLSSIEVEDDEPEGDPAEESEPLDEVPPARSQTPKNTASTPTKEQQAKVQALLNRKLK